MRRNRRQHERSAACMPAWVCNEETGLRRQGHTLNISAGGVYVLAALETEAYLGKTLSVTIGTHSGCHGGQDLHRCECSARVVRTDHLGYAVGVALEFIGEPQRMEVQHQLMPC